MMAAPAELDVSVVGEGPAVLFIHGSAVDRSTWSLQRVRLSPHLRLILYDRRGTNGAGGIDGATPLSVAQHADDAAAIIDSVSPGRPVVVCGSSFGAVIALELIRRWPTKVRHAVLLEPPLHPAETPDAESLEALAEFDRRARHESGPAAAAFFLERILGDDAFLRIAGPYRRRAEERWQEIRRDWAALLEYRPGYATLHEVHTPVLLLGGERSHPRFRPPLLALHAALGNARLEFLPCGHTIQAEAHRALNEQLVAISRGVE